MRLAISVIGWDSNQDEAALAALAETGAEGIEAAPTRLWGSWEDITDDAVDRWRELLASFGLACPALQSLFYGVEGASLTGDKGERHLAAEQLRRVATLAGRLRARVAVLGSPDNRRRDGLSHAEATARARETLTSAADQFASHGVQLAVEPNPQQYNCDFLTTYAEVREFIAAVDHQAVAAHLDTGELLINEEEPDLDGALPAHVHLSAPDLHPFSGQPRAWHLGLLRRLRKAGYSGWVSIEQRPSAQGLAGAAQAIRAARSLLDATDDADG